MIRAMRRAWNRLLGSFSGRRADRELSEELESHIRLMAEDLVRGGAARDDAYRRARLTFGSVESTTEHYRERRGLPGLDAFRDLRYAVRSLLRDRGSVALAVLALSLGIGATTVIFSVVYSVLVNSFPFKDQSTVVHFYVQRPDGTSIGGTNFTTGEFLAYRAQNRVFSHVLGGANMAVLYEVDNTTHYVEGALLDPQALSALGLTPILGRDSTEADGAENAPPTFLMSDRYWSSQFNRDPGVIGRTFKMNGVTRTLIGIAPPRFLLFGANVFFPTSVRANWTEALRGGSSARPLSVFTFARLKPGVTVEQAEADIERVARDLAQQFHEYPKQPKVVVRSLADVYTAPKLKEMVWILVGAVLMLLLIACSNVANLLLARANARETEMAVRASLGASRGRLARQLLSESFVLASMGTAIGGLLAYGGMQWVRATIPRSALPSEMAIRFSVDALAATIVVTFLTALICGAFPALRAARGDLQKRLIGTGKGGGLRAGHSKVRMLLVTVQVTLAIVLLVGSGLMMRSLHRLQQIDPGMDTSNILTGGFVVPLDRQQSPAERNLFLQQVLEKVHALPGVVAASPSAGMPIQSVQQSEVAIPGVVIPPGTRVAVEYVGENYFRALGIPLVKGRLLSDTDVSGARRTSVVNRQFAQMFLGGADPIGRTITLAAVDQRADPKHPQLFEVVGVVGDARNAGLEGVIRPEAYLPYTVPGAQSRGILIKTRVDPLTIQHSVRQQIWAVDQNVALAAASSLDNVLERAYLASPKFGFGLMTTFAAVGLILSAIGVFSVMAYAVSLQKHEIGIRMALGAEPSGVMRMILLKGLRPILTGMAIGVTASYWLTRVMANQISGISTTDPWTFAGGVLVLGVVGIAACVLPARRAMRVDPLTALRAE